MILLNNIEIRKFAAKAMAQQITMVNVDEALVLHEWARVNGVDALISIELPLSITLGAVAWRIGSVDYHDLDEVKVLDFPQADLDRLIRIVALKTSDFSQFKQPNIRAKFNALDIARISSSDLVPTPPNDPVTILRAFLAMMEHYKAGTWSELTNIRKALDDYDAAPSSRRTFIPVQLYSFLPGLGTDNLAIFTLMNRFGYVCQANRMTMVDELVKFTGPNRFEAMSKFISTHIPQPPVAASVPVATSASAATSAPVATSVVVSPKPASSGNSTPKNKSGKSTPKKKKSQQTKGS
jgi:hypothetical protein